MPELANILALDIGDKRVGVALARAESLMASPLVTLDNSERLINEIKDLIDQNQVSILVVGLPRGMDGQDTQQTEKIKIISDKIASATGMAINYQDEALTSVKAKEELDSRGKMYSKSDVDKLAACYILEDYISEEIK